MNLTGKSMIDQARIEWGIRLRFSPMPRLDMDWIVTQLNSFRIGALWECARTWEIMMERDIELQSSANKRFEDVSSLDYQITGEDSAEGRAHKAALEYFCKNLTVTDALDQDAVGDLSKLFWNIAEAHAYKYSVHEILMRVDNAGKKQVTAEFRKCPLWFFEARRGYLGYLPHLFDMYGQPLKAGEWLPAVGFGYMRACSIIYAMKWFATRDQMLFSQRMGIPWVHATTQAAINSPEWNQALELLATLGNDGAVLTNEQVKIALLEATSKADGNFSPIIENCNRGYDRAFRGSDLASGSRMAPSGGGKVVGASVQGGEKDILLRADAVWITPILQMRLVRPLIAYLFGVEPKACIKVMGPTDEDTDIDVEAFPLAQSAKIPYAISTFREKFNVPEPKPGEPLIQWPASVAPVALNPDGTPANPDDDAATGAIAPGANPNRNPQEPDPRMPGGGKPLQAYNFPGGQERALANALTSKLEENSRALLANAVADDLDHVFGRLNAILKIPDDEVLLKKLIEFVNDYPALKASVLADPTAARAFQAILGAALANGLAGSTPPK